MISLPVLKAAGVIVGLYFLLRPATKPASTGAPTTEDDPPPTTYPHRPNDSDVGVDPGGSVTITGGTCVGDCAGKTMDCPGDPECP